MIRQFDRLPVGSRGGLTLGRAKGDAPARFVVVRMHPDGSLGVAFEADSLSGPMAAAIARSAAGTAAA